MKVVIRPLAREDAFISVNWRNNPSIWEFTLNKPDRKIDIKDELAWMDKALKEPDSCRRAIICEGNYVGNIYLTRINGDEAYMGIFIGEQEYIGKSVARKAGEQILDFAGSSLDLEIIRVRVDKRNTRALGLYKRLGFIIDREDETLVYMINYIKVVH